MKIYLWVTDIVNSNSGVLIHYPPTPNTVHWFVNLVVNQLTIIYPYMQSLLQIMALKYENTSPRTVTQCKTYILISSKIKNFIGSNMGYGYKTEASKPTLMCWSVCNPVIWYSQNFGDPQSLINNVSLLGLSIYISSGSMTSSASTYKTVNNLIYSDWKFMKAVTEQKKNI